MPPLRILFISPYLPSRIRVRPYSWIKYLGERGHRITLLALIPPGDDSSNFQTIRPWCHDVITVPLPRWRTLWNGLQAIPGTTPLQAAYSRSPDMARLIQRVQTETEFDVTHIEHLRGSEFSRAVRHTPIVFDSVDSIALLFEQVCQSGPTWRSRLLARLDLVRTRHYEGKLLDRFPRVLVTSPRDRDALAALSSANNANNRLVVLPNGVDLDYFTPLDVPREPAALIFTGKMSYHANIAAALDLATQVMPTVWEQLPKARLIVAGKDPAAELLALTSDRRITVTGTVPDLRPYLAQATLAASPMRYGVGIQNKVLEAMAMAIPVVSTAQAVSALQVQPGREALVVDDLQAMAKAILALLTDTSLRQRIGQAGRNYVETHHDWKVTTEKLEAVYREVIAESQDK